MYTKYHYYTHVLAGSEVKSYKWFCTEYHCYKHILASSKKRKTYMTSTNVNMWYSLVLKVCILIRNFLMHIRTSYIGQA